MSDYISREEVGKALTTAEPVNNGGIKYNRYPPSHDEVLKRISAIPAADVAERKHGAWYWHSTIFRSCYRCTNCQKPSPFEFDFCPNCGADMRIKDGDDDV